MKQTLSGNWLSGALASRLARKPVEMWADRRGVAAIELGIFATFLALGLANVTDVSIYIYQRMHGECDRGCGTSRFEDLQHQLAGNDQLFRPVNRHAECVAEHFAGYKGCLCHGLPDRGILLHQFIQHTAIYERRILEARRLHGCGHAGVAAR